MFTRADYLNFPGVPVARGDTKQTHSPGTISKYRITWSELSEWTDFAEDLRLFSNSISPEELNRLNAPWRDQDLEQFDRDQWDSISLPATENQLNPHMDSRWMNPHNKITMPLQNLSEIIRFGDGYGTFGDPDYLFKLRGMGGETSLHAVMELKTFWKVLPEMIHALLDGLPPPIQPRGNQVNRFSGILAVEQIFGYMVHCARRYGVLTTVNYWVFLKRENGARLWMTRPLDCRMLNPFTIRQALYYISAIAPLDGTLPETGKDGKPVHVNCANYKAMCEAPSVYHTGERGDIYYPPKPSKDGTIIRSHSESVPICPCGATHTIILEPWKAGNCLGHNTFRASWFPGNLSVVAKVWDSYKHSSERRDHEVTMYMRLQKLWGRQIPQFVCSADLDFCYGIILEEVKGTPVAEDNLTFNIEARINKAYESLHELGIVHGDVHPDHILVLEDGSIRIIDFDCAFIVPVGYDKLIDFEEEEINNLLRELKGHKHSEIGD